MKENLKYLKIHIYLIICILRYILPRNQVVHINDYSDYSFHYNAKNYSSGVCCRRGWGGLEEAEILAFVILGYSDEEGLRHESENWQKWQFVCPTKRGVMRLWSPYNCYRVTIDFPATNSRNTIYHSSDRWVLAPAFPPWTLVLLLVLGLMTSW